MCVRFLCGDRPPHVICRARCFGSNFLWKISNQFLLRLRSVHLCARIHQKWLCLARAFVFVMCIYINYKFFFYCVFLLKKKRSNSTEEKKNTHTSFTNTYIHTYTLLYLLVTASCIFCNLMDMIDGQKKDVKIGCGFSFRVVSVCRSF